MARVVVFDAYGTLFDVNAAARRLASEPGREAFAALWQQVARDWRAKQLEYSWMRAITGAHADFGKVTQDGLDWALEAAGIADDGDLRARLMALYLELDAYTEVRDVLAALDEARIATGILSNGSPAMLDAAVESAGIGGHLDMILSVESVGVFKPAREVYDLVGEAFGAPREEVLFVSSNGWDAACATGYGFPTAWVNREQKPRERMPWTPSWTLPDLREITAIATGARPPDRTG